MVCNIYMCIYTHIYNICICFIYIYIMLNLTKPSENTYFKIFKELEGMYKTTRNIKGKRYAIDTSVKMRKTNERS